MCLLFCHLRDHQFGTLEYMKYYNFCNIVGICHHMPLDKNQIDRIINKQEIQQNVAFFHLRDRHLRDRFRSPVWIEMEMLDSIVNNSWTICHTKMTNHLK